MIETDSCFGRGDRVFMSEYGFGDKQNENAGVVVEAASHVDAENFMQSRLSFVILSEESAWFTIDRRKFYSQKVMLHLPRKSSAQFRSMCRAARLVLPDPRSMNISLPFGGFAFRTGIWLIKTAVYANCRGEIAELEGN
jgi:hypothetical protein